MINNIKNNNGNIIPNLKVQNDVITSYETDVAIIDHKTKTIKAHKWYSQTTTRHIKAVAGLYHGYAIVVVDTSDKNGWRNYMCGNCGGGFKRHEMKFTEDHDICKDCEGK